MLDSLKALVSHLSPSGMSPHLFPQPSSNKVTFFKGLPSSVSSSTAPGTSPIPPIYYSTLCDNWGDSHELPGGRNPVIVHLQFHPVNTGHGPDPIPSLISFSHQP